ncbi:signal recognition particle protein [bacterium]|nr:signal recognition particle protein [bacterium]
MLDNLSDKLQGILKRLRGQGKLTEKNIGEALKEVRIALLEADVNYKVVKGFIERISSKAVGEEVLKSLTPGQQVIKIVHQELIDLMGGHQSKIQMPPNPPLVIMMVGLQGSGKTTTAGKLASMFKKDGRRPMLVAADVQRPAARDQLKVLADSLGVDCFLDHSADRAERVCRDAFKIAEKNGMNPVIIDTAGRLHVDKELMDELVQIKKKILPHEVILVADAMTGQDAVTMAQEFDQKVGIDSIILTKMDGDARGGAALSIREVTGKPVKFIGTGEKLDLLEPFFPDRMASRILGMGDLLSLIEKAQNAYTQEEAIELEKKLQKDSYTLEDFRQQLRQVKSMGPLEQLIKMIPGASKMGLQTLDMDESNFVRLEAIIDSMTPQERRNYQIINASRKKRIALGSGTNVQDVSRLLNQFHLMKKNIKRIKKMGFGMGGGGFGMGIRRFKRR